MSRPYTFGNLDNTVRIAPPDSGNVIPADVAATFERISGAGRAGMPFMGSGDRLYDRGGSPRPGMPTMSGGDRPYDPGNAPFLERIRSASPQRIQLGVRTGSSPTPMFRQMSPPMRQASGRVPTRQVSSNREAELDAQIKSMLRHVHQNLATAEADSRGDSGTAPPQEPVKQRLGDIEAAAASARAAMVAVEHERLMRSQEIAELRGTISSQQEWLKQELLSRADVFAKLQANAKGAALDREETQARMLEMHAALGNAQAEALGQMQAEARAMVDEVSRSKANLKELVQHEMQALINKTVDERMHQAPWTSAQIHTEVQNFGNSLQKEYGQLSQNVSAECEARTRSINDLHARLQYDGAALRKHTEQMRLVLKDGAAKDKASIKQEISELRGIVDSLFEKVTALKVEPNQPQYFKFDDGDRQELKACVGDTEDIHTLYEMVREALGDNVRLTKELETERIKRERELINVQLERDKLERHVKSLQHTVGGLEQRLNTGMQDIQHAIPALLRDGVLRPGPQRPPPA